MILLAAARFFAVMLKTRDPAATALQTNRQPSRIALCVGHFRLLVKSFSSP
jgi:hypothetical protein